MEYFDFELRVFEGSGREYPVSVKSPAGPATGKMHFPFDTLALEHQLRGVELAVLKSSSLRRDFVVASAETESLTDFGKKLFGALFSEQVQTAYRRSQDRAQAERKGLRVRLQIEAPELAALPWEFMYDPSEGDYVCLSTATPVVRYLEFDRPPEVLTVQPPLSVLALIASPIDRPTLNVQHERDRIDTATRRLQEAGLLKIAWMEGSTWRDLQRAMRRGTYHVLHFVGHGGFERTSGEGVLALTDESGRSALLGATEMGRLLADHHSLRMVVLNSCLGAKGSGTDLFSSTSSILVRRGVAAVVAMQYEISDLAAIEFSRSLYEAIADGMPIDAAVAEARKAVSVSSRNSVEWGTPVLHMRSPDGVLFKIDGPTPSAIRAATPPGPVAAPRAHIENPVPVSTTRFPKGIAVAAAAVALAVGLLGAYLMTRDPAPPAQAEASVVTPPAVAETAAPQALAAPPRAAPAPPVASERLSLTGQGGAVADGSSGGTTFDLVVSDSRAIAATGNNVTVTLNHVQHGALVDLTARLEHVGYGQPVGLFDRVLNSAGFICAVAVRGTYTFNSAAPTTLQSQCGTGGVGSQPRLVPEGSYRTTQPDDLTNSNLSEAWNGKPAAGLWRLSITDTNVNTGANQFVLNADWTWQLDIEVRK